MKYRFRILEEAKGTEAEKNKKELAKALNKAYKSNPQKMAWAKKMSDAVNKVDDDKLQMLADAVEEEYGDLKVDKKVAKTIIDASGQKIDKDDERLAGLNTISKIFAFFDMSKLIKEKPKVARAILAIILGFVPVVGPILSMFAAIIPQEILVTIFDLGKYFDPMHHLSNKIDKAVEKEQKKVDKKKSKKKEA